MTTTHTTESVLHSKGIKGEGATLIDNAREAGIMHACLGCGSVTGIDMTVPTTTEANRLATRDSIDWEEFDCCPDADSILF